MAKLSDVIKTSNPPKILMYGKVGSGKTALTLTLGSKLTMIDMDDGLRTGLTLQDKFTEDRKSVEVVQFLEREPHKTAGAFAAVKNYIYGLSSRFQKRPYPFEALALDSLTAYADAALNYIMFNSGKLGKQPEIQHWGLAFAEIKNVLQVMRSLPIIVVVIAHEQVKSVGTLESREESLEIAVKGRNLPAEICRLFDEIWYIRSRAAAGGKFDYVLQTHSDALLEARSRSQLPNYTNTNIGMWEIIRKLGYELPKEVNM